jgi:M6 family metalloprotease-like protein
MRQTHPSIPALLALEIGPMTFITRVTLALLAFATNLPAAAPPASPPPLPPGYGEYRTVHTAIRSRISRAAPTPAAAQPGYLGVTVEEKDARFLVAGVEAGSPAAKAGLAPGDVISRVEGRPLKDTETLGDLVRAKGPGGRLLVAVERAGKPLEVSVTLAATSRPLTPGRRVVLGVQVEEVPEGIKLTGVTAGAAAERARLQAGDVITAIDGVKVAAGSLALETALSAKQPGDQLRLTVKRGDKALDVTATLAAEPAGGAGRRGNRGWDDRLPRIYTRPVYRLAVVCIEYPDVKHNAKIKPSDWEDSLFSTDTYTGRSVTGQRVYGSMNDYYREQSCGQFSVEGKCFDWVTVKRKRAEYGNDSNRTALLTEALDVLLARDGKNALDGFQGVYFLYAGERAQARRGGLYWPHRATMRHQGRAWPITHEFGHMLGLPDLYARPEVPGQEGLGVWCTMSTGHGRDGKPLHYSAWCKVQMGWLKPAEIDPRVKQKIVLGAVNGSTTECVKVPLRADGSEYLLLENRRRIGFDHDLPAEGLLIWRVIDGRPVLEESHGIAGPAGPGLHLPSIPYPSGSNTAFTPYTTPSSKSLKGGGLPVHITNIRRLPDGRIAFHIGYEYL